MVDPDRRQVTVATPDGRAASYSPGDRIPLPFPGAALPVEEIFG